MKGEDRMRLSFSVILYSTKGKLSTKSINKLVIKVNNKNKNKKGKRKKYL